MCLYVETGDYETLSSGVHTARQDHTCTECRRTIEPGERYRYWNVLHYDDDAPTTWKMCAHCWGTIDLGAALTGCPKTWWWNEVHNANDPDMGFVANILHDEGHTLTRAQKRRMLRTVEGRRAGWRRADGRLRPVPAPRTDDPHYAAVPS